MLPERRVGIGAVLGQFLPRFRRYPSPAYASAITAIETFIPFGRTGNFAP